MNAHPTLRGSSAEAARLVIAVKRWQRAIEPGSTDAHGAAAAGTDMLAVAGEWLVASKQKAHSRAQYAAVELVMLALTAGVEVAS